MIFERVWAMPNRDTFTISPIGKLVSRYVHGHWADPFCGKSNVADVRNDLNPLIENCSHISAKNFLCLLETNSFDGVIFDPPYSPRQISECYKGIGLKVMQKDTQNQWKTEKDNIARVIKIGGKCLTFGWNSNAIGKGRGFKIIEILLVAHGGAHNDTICTVELKI